MIQEDKQLLFKDLCARLPYGVMIEITSDDGMVEVSCDMMLDAGLLADLLYQGDDFKPYLRPLSSMTKEEVIEYLSVCDKDYKDSLTTPGYSGVDWLNSHHFDYRIVPSTGKSMIESGLALEASEDMYKTK